MLLPVIMAGGTGSRLWPMSRELYPKQFLRLFGQNSMLQETITRLSVSYTHLDVYKRQTPCCRKPSPDSRALKSMNRWSSVTKSTASWWPNTVSYTHLDVYKRQV